MGTWTRCPKTSFYKRTSRGAKLDKRAEAFDRAYVDPVDLVLVRTLPWREDFVQILHWRVVELDKKTFLDLDDQPADILSAWSGRVIKTMEGGISKKEKEALLEDLDVDLHARDLLLDAIELFVNVSPPEATSFTQKKVLRNDEAVSGLLFYFGVGPC